MWDEFAVYLVQILDARDADFAAENLKAQIILLTAPASDQAHADSSQDEVGEHSPDMFAGLFLPAQSEADTAAPKEVTNQETV